MYLIMHAQQPGFTMDFYVTNNTVGMWSLRNSTNQQWLLSEEAVAAGYVRSDKGAGWQKESCLDQFA